MKITLFLIWLFFLVFFALPSCKSENHSLDLEKQLKHGHVLMSTKHVIKVAEAHGDDHLSVFQRPRAIYGGANDLKRPRTNRSGSSSMLLNPSLLFAAALGHLAIGFFL